MLEVCVLEEVGEEKRRNEKWCVRIVFVRRVCMRIVCCTKSVCNESVC